MATRILPTVSDGRAHISYTIVLDGDSFYIHMDFNARDEHWYISVHDATNTPIEGCVGRRIVTNWPILHRATAAGRPAGNIITSSADHEDPGLYDLGNRVKLYYVEASNV